MNEHSVTGANAAINRLKSLRLQEHSAGLREVPHLDVEKENAALWATLNALTELVLIPTVQRSLRLCVALRSVQEGLPLSLKQIDDLWQQSSDLLMEIDEHGDVTAQRWSLSDPFFIWPKGTSREEIRAWFEEQYHKNGTSLGERWFSEAKRA